MSSTTEIVIKSRYAKINLFYIILLARDEILSYTKCAIFLGFIQVVYLTWRCKISVNLESINGIISRLKYNKTKT